MKTLLDKEEERTGVPYLIGDGQWRKIKVDTLLKVKVAVYRSKDYVGDKERFFLVMGGHKQQFDTVGELINVLISNLEAWK